MLPPHEEPESLQIRCPACSQRFKVGVDLRDRMVECGSCEHRFRIDDETIVRSKKFYPGERKDTRLDGFARVPHAPSHQPNIQTVQYAAEPSQASFEPPSPQRILAAIVGVAGMLVVAAVLFYGDRRGGLLDGVQFSGRLAIAAFAGVLGSVMVIYGNPRGRVKAIAVSIVFLVGLITLPFVFNKASEPLESKVPVGIAPAKEEVKLVDDRARIMGIEPLLRENARVSPGDARKAAVGVWLRGMRLSNKSKAMEYLLRATGASPSSHLYPRDDDNWLIVLSGSSLPIEEISLLAGKFASDREDTRIHSDLGVIEVKVDNNVFVEGPLDKLQDKNSPAFYDLNRRELESIDLERSMKAAKRVADAEPKIYRDDITRLLTQLVKDAGVDPVKLGDLSRALTVWAPESDTKSVAEMTVAFQKLRAEKILPSRDMVTFLTNRKATMIAPLLEEMWVADATSWEPLYGNLGPVIEPLLLKRFPDTVGSLRQSTVRLLGRVGGAKSATVLQAAQAGADTEQRVLIERALKEISTRK